MDDRRSTFKESTSFSARHEDEQTGASILMVDDEKGILESYKHYLSAKPSAGVVRSARVSMSEVNPVIKETYHLHPCTTGEMAVETVKLEFDAGRRIQVGFFDMKMPGGIDGLETIRQCRAIDPDIYCIIVTAYQDRSLDEIGRVFGNAYDHWDYLNKPFSGNEIVQKARNAIALWRRRRRHEALINEMEETNRKLAQQFREQIQELENARTALAERRKSLSPQKDDL